MTDTNTKLEPWIETYHGHKLWFLNPQENQIDIEDIAHSLANECRFGGHTSSFYSVAEHSTLVATMLPDSLSLAGLLHDASEAYLRDIASPIKQYLGPYKDIEDKLMVVIAKKYGFTWPLDPAVKEADTIALKVEASYLLPSGGKDWIHLYPTSYMVNAKPMCLPPAKAKRLFLDVFNHLTGEEEHTPNVWVPPEKEIVIAT